MIERMEMPKLIVHGAGIIPGIYHHYKGATYWVSDVSVVHDTGRRIVHYHSSKSADQRIALSRDYDDFCAVVTWPDGKQRPRFIREGY